MGDVKTKMTPTLDELIEINLMFDNIEGMERPIEETIAICKRTLKEEWGVIDEP